MRSPAALELLDDLDRAVDRRALFVGREEERDRAGGVRMRGDEGLDRGDERRERAFHVRRAAAVEPAVALGRHERVGLPRRERAGRHDVGVTGEAHERTRAPAAQPAVANAVRDQRLGAKSERRQARRDQVLAAGVVGGERAPLDQRARQRERLGGKALRRGRVGGIHAECETAATLALVPCVRAPGGTRSPAPSAVDPACPARS